MLKIRKSEGKLLLWTVLYKCLLDLIYIFVISHFFNYEGFRIYFSSVRIIASYLLLVLFFLLVKESFHKKTFSNKVILVLFYMSFIPFISYVSLNNTMVYFIFLNILYWLVLFTFNKLFFYFRLKQPSKKISIYVFYGVFIMYIVCSLYYCYKYGGFHIQLSLDVYDLRDASRDYQTGTLLRYFIDIAKYIGPIYLVYFLDKKNKLSILVLIVQFLLFGSTGSKSTLFATISIVLVYYFSEKLFYIFPSVLSLGSIISLFEYIFLNSYNIVNFFIRRILFLPQYLHCVYFDFFSNNPPDFFTQSIFEKLGFSSNYSEPISSIIGKMHYGREVYANNGLFSDAYANLDWYGMIIMPILLVLVFRLFDASNDCSKKILYSCLVPVILIFQSSSFFISLISHGIIVFILLLYFMPGYRKEL